MTTQTTADLLTERERILAEHKRMMAVIEADVERNRFALRRRPLLEGTPLGKAILQDEDAKARQQAAERERLARLTPRVRQLLQSSRLGREALEARHARR